MGKLFISYSHEDKKWMKQLTSHLTALKKHADTDLDFWVDTDISAGEEWHHKIKTAIDEADAAVLLVSPNFLESDFVGNEEIPKLLARQEKEGINIFPLLIHHCPWQEVPWLNALQVRPTGGKSLAELSKPKQNKALSDFATEIKSILKGKKAKPSEELSPPQVELYKLPDTGEYFFGREEELKMLDDAWADPDIHIISLVAWGGAGKTSLVNQWLKQMKRDHFRGARNVFGWSFYSQGAEEGKQTSAEEFLREQLDNFGDPDPSTGTDVDRGRRLAKLVRNGPALLVLDGMEPLQYPAGEAHEYDGRLKDRGVQAFLRATADGIGNKSLVVVTTREPLGGLDKYKDDTFRQHNLENLDTDSGVQLLKRHGVRGTETDLEQAVEEYGGHALALDLLGSYIGAVYDGNIRKRDKISALAEAPNRPGAHARRMLAAYEEWLGESAELELLRIMGLFDRPVPPGALKTLLEPPAIPGVTNGLSGKTIEEIRWAMSRLRRSRLLADEKGEHGNVSTTTAKTTGLLDCHPLIREYFARKLSKRNPDGWKAAHRRLYEYFKRLPEKMYPDTLEEMAPLFSAVAHGCRAGEYFDVLDNVYNERIRRRKEAYNIKKLGAFGMDLAVLSNFFEIPWKKIVPGLLESDEGVLLSWVGFRLRAVGRLREAVLPMEKGMEIMLELKEWRRAAVASENLSVLKLTLGEVNAALQHAWKAMEYADESECTDRQVYVRYSLADALHQAGELEEADHWFNEAEKRAKEHHLGIRFFYTLGFMQLCDRLLSKGSIDGLMSRAEKIKQTANLEGNDLLGEALYYLSIGMILFKKVQQGKEKRYESVITPLTTAVDGLRASGYQDFLEKGLLTRAAFYRLTGQFQKAETDLDEAREIAEIGDMKLFLCDYHLETARLLTDQGKMKDAEFHFRQAKELIEKTGYHRRDQELPGGM